MGRITSAIREFFVEVRARRAGRQAMGPNAEFFQTARGIVGATGNSFSNAWDHLDTDGDRYARSMQKNPVLPPSLFVSDRDRTRQGQPTPVVERCLEDIGNPDAIPVVDWDIAKLEETAKLDKSALLDEPAMPDDTAERNEGS